MANNILFLFLSTTMFYCLTANASNWKKREFYCKFGLFDSEFDQYIHEISDDYYKFTAKINVHSSYPESGRFETTTIKLSQDNELYADLTFHEFPGTDYSPRVDVIVRDQNQSIENLAYYTRRENLNVYADVPVFFDEFEFKDQKLGDATFDIFFECLGLVDL